MTAKSVKDFSSFFKQKAVELQKTHNYKNLNDLYKGLYTAGLNLSEDPGAKETRDIVLQHLVLAPIAINGVIAELQNEVASDMATSLAALTSPTKLEELVNTFLEKVSEPFVEEDKIEEPNIYEGEGPFKPDLDLTNLGAIRSEINSILGRETIPNSNNTIDVAKAFPYAVTRSVLDAVNSGSEDFKLLSITYEELQKRVDLKDVDFSVHNKPTVHAEKSHISLVVTDKAGNILKFDSTGKVSPTGKIPLYGIPYTTKLKDSIYAYRNNKKNLSDPLHRKIQLMEEKYSAETVEYELASALEINKKLIDLTRSQGSLALIIDPTTSTFGYNEVTTETTPMSRVNNSPSFSVVKNTEAGKNFYGVTGSTLHDTIAPLIPNDIDSSPETVSMLIDIMTNDSLTVEGTKLSADDIRKLVGNYIQINKEAYVSYNDNGTVRVYNKTYKKSSPELKIALNNFFKTFTPVSVVKENTENRIVVKDLNAPGITSAMLFDDGTGTLYKIYKPKFSFLNPKNNVVVTDGKVITSPMSDSHILDNSSTKAFINSNNDLRVYHAKLGFEIDPASIEASLDKTQEQKDANEKILEIANKAALSWSKSSPLLTKEGPLELRNAEMASKDRPQDRVAVARWVQNAIILFKGSDYTDIYHEAWHAYTQGILTSAEKKSLYDTVRTTLGKTKTDLEVEEYLAEAFRAYAISEGKKVHPNSKINQFFKALYETLQKLFGTYTKSELSNPHIAHQIVKDNFEALYTHNIDVEKYDPSNFSFHSMNKTLTFPEGKGTLTNLNAQQTSLLLNTVDSLVSKKLISKTNERLTRGFDSLSDMLDGYKGVKEDIKNLWDQEAKALIVAEKGTDLNAVKFHSDNIQMLEAAFEHFGDTEVMSNNLSENSDPKSVIGFHIKYGHVYNYSNIKSITTETTKDEDTASTKLFERTGTESSLKDMADKNILFLLSTIDKYETSRKTIGKEDLLNPSVKEQKRLGTVEFSQVPVFNSLGIISLEQPAIILAKLGKLLNSTSNGDKMVALMTEAAKTDPVIAQVLEKLGSFNTNSVNHQLIWSKFIQTFSKSNNKLQQFIIERTIVEPMGDNKKKTVTIDSKYGTTLSGTTSVSRAWDIAFPTFRTKYIQNVNGSIVLDAEAVLKDFLVESPNGTWKLKRTDDYVNFYRALGINITDKQEIEKELSKNSDILDAIASRLKNHVDVQEFNLASGKSTYSISSIKDIIGKHSKVNNAENGLIEMAGLNSYYNRLQRIEFNLSDKYNSFMSSTAEGESASELSLNNSLSVMVNDINEFPEGTTIDEIIVKAPHLAFLKVETDPFMQSNNWHKALFSNGVKTKVKLNLDNFAGTSLLHKDDTYLGTSNMNLDAESKFMTDVYLSFYNKSEVVRMADKTTSMHVGTNTKNIINPSIYLTLQKDDSNPMMFKALKDYIVSEIVRANLLKSVNTPFDQAYKKRGGKFFIFDNILDSKTKKALMASTSTNYVEVSKFVESNIKSLNLIEQVNKYFKSKTDTSILKRSANLFITDNILERINTEVNESALEGEEVKVDAEMAKEIMIGMYERNKFLHNVDFTTFFLGDPAIYNVSKEAFHKRVAGIVSTGDVFRTDSSFYNYINQKTEAGVRSARGWSNKVSGKDSYGDYKGEITTAVISDHKTGSEYYDLYKEVLADSSLYGEGKINEADGQGFISFDAYRLLSIAQGIWTIEQEDQYNIIVNESTADDNGNIIPGEYDQTKYHTFFQSMKLQHFGRLKTDSPLAQMAFHKFNLVPLIPGMIAGTKLEKLHKQMMEQGVDYMTFESGSKLSTISKESGPDIFYNQDRSLNEDLVFEKNVIFSKYLKNQLAIHNHFLGKVTLATQMRKVVILNTKKNGAPIDAKTEEWLNSYEGTLTKLRNFKELELKNQLGITDPKSLLQNSEKLVALIRREFDSNDYTENQVEFLFDNEKLKQELSTALTADKLEKLLIALVDKRLTKIKVTGEGLIQMASTMSEKIDAVTKKDTPEQQFASGSNDLRAYYTKDGKVIGAQCKIALQGSFEKLLYINDLSGKKITVFKKNSSGRKVLDYNATLKALNILLKNEEWVNKNRAIITLVSPRIPTAETSFLEFMEIAEFLPKNSGSLIVVPTEIVVKAGSDFDVDKLFTMFPSIEIYNGSPEVIKYIDINIDLNVLSNEISEHRLKIQEINNKISELYETIDELGISKKINAELYELYAAAKQLATFTDPIVKEQLLVVEEDIKRLEEEKENTISEGLKNKELTEMQEDIKARVDLLIKEKNKFNLLIDSVKRKINGSSVKGIENELLQSFVDRLSWEENFEELIKPSSNNLVEGTADKLSEVASDFNKYETEDGTPRKKEDGTKAISETMIFDPAYNINKQLENSVGMDTLGIGAVGSSYFALYTRMGMYLNATNGKTQKEIDRLKALPIPTEANLATINAFQNYSIRLNSNRTETGGVDLAKQLNVSGENISHIIAQLINGWVDVAADAWIFNIQGNKEVAPTLLFLVMAGVDFNQAVILSSSKLVREYISNKRMLAGALYGLKPLNKDNPKTFNLIQKYEDVDAFNLIIKRRNLGKAKEDQEEYFSNINEIYSANQEYDSALDMDALEKLVLAPNKERTAEEDLLEEQALVEYIAYEQTATQLRALTTATRFDTKTFSSLAEIRNNQAAFENLNSNAALPSDIKAMILNSSPIGMFNTNPLQLGLWSQFFSLKTKQAISIAANKNYKGKLKQTGRNTADNEKDFAEEFLSYLYQNESTRIENNSYGGYSFDVMEGESEEEFVVEGSILKYNEAIVNSYVEDGVLGNKNSILKFFVEKHKAGLEFDNNRKSIENSISYQLALQNVDIDVENENYDDQLRDEYLDAEAAYKSQNSHLLFNGSVTYADRLLKLKEKYPSLEKRFTLVHDLTSDSKQKGKTNLYLTNLEQDNYKNIYEENLLELKEHSDPEISSFFKMFDHYAVLQSGVKSYGKYVMTSIIDQNHLHKIVGPIANDVKNKLDMLYQEGLQSYNVLDDFTEKFYQIDLSDPVPTDGEAFKRFLIQKNRGASYESDGYFTGLSDENYERSYSLELMDNMKFIPYADSKMADQSQQVIIHTVENTINPTYKKISKINKYKAYTNQYFPEVLTKEYKKEDTVWIVGESVNPIAYNKSENNKEKYKKSLDELFETSYKADIDRALEAIGISFVVGSNSGIEQSAREYLKTKELKEHKLVNSEGLYYKYSLEPEIIVDQLYSTGVPEIKVLDNASVLGLKGVTVSLAIGTKPYNDFYRYLAARKSSYATPETNALLKEKASQFKAEPTPEEWMSIIKEIELDPAKQDSYDQSFIITNALTSVASSNKAFKETLMDTKTNLLTFGSGLSQFEKDFGNALMQLRKTFNGPVLALTTQSIVKEGISSTSVGNMTLKEYADKTSARFIEVRQVLKKDDIEYFNDRVNDLIADRLKYAIFAKEDLNNRQYLPFINKLKENGFIQVENMPWVFSKNGVNPKEEYAKLTSQPSTSVKPTIDTSREWSGDLKRRPVYTPEGVNTMRTEVANKDEHFGNPFSEAGYGGTIKVSSIGAAVRMYKDWLLNNAITDSEIVSGSVNDLVKFNNQRTWILDQINQGKLDGATLLYAGKSEARGQGMHPTALAEVVEELRSSQLDKPSFIC